MKYLSPVQLADLSIPLLTGVVTGGTILAALMFYVSENTDLALRKKRVINTLSKGSESDHDVVDESDLIPFEDLKNLIPKRLFERSLWRSAFHMLIVLLVCVSLQILYHCTVHGLENHVGGALKSITVLAFDIAFILLCGTCETGLWVVAHECGHNAFSKYEALNDTIGFILHSYLLAPYFS